MKVHLKSSGLSNFIADIDGGNLRLLSSGLKIV